LRRPRYLSEEWYRNPDTCFGCRQCGQRLAAIEGPAASRPSEVAIDGVPDPEGTLRAVMTRDPLAPVRSDPSEGASLSLRSILGPPLAGIDLKSQVLIRRPGGPEWVVPFAFTRHGLPWVVWRAVEVVDAGGVAAGIAGSGPDTGPDTGPDGVLDGVFEIASVEAAFVVAIDLTANWRVIKLDPRPPG